MIRYRIIKQLEGISGDIICDTVLIPKDEIYEYDTLVQAENVKSSLLDDNRYLNVNLLIQEIHY